MMTRRTVWGAAMIASGVLAAGALGQECGNDESRPAEAAAKAAQVVADTATPADAEPVPTLQEMQRELRKIRAKYLGTMRNRELRQIGIAKIREYTDPVIYPDLLEIFAREKEDVRTAILDHLFDQKNGQADATLAWAAMFDRQEWFREAALERIRRRTAEVGQVPERVQWAIAAGLKQRDSDDIGRAADLAADLRLYDAIPMLINLQVQGSSSVGSTSSGAGGDLAYIFIGRQQAFVSDLEPVVGNSAVGFDPQLSVATEGTVMRVQGASVVTYRTVVHNALVRLADSGWDGRSTASLGYDKQAWRDWYVREFLPYRERLAATTQQPQPTPTTPPAAAPR
jgi:hypothetical protein